MGYFDSIKDQNVIYKKKEPSFPLPQTSVDVVPLWEAWKLFVNRLGDLLQIYVDPDVSEVRENYFWLKAFQAAADTLLFSLGKYVSDVTGRSENWKKLKRDQKQFGLEIPGKYLILLDAALRARAEHNLHNFIKEAASFSNKEKSEVILYFFNRIEKNMFKEEGLDKAEYESYLADKALMNKYAGLYIGKIFSNIYSNLFVLLFGGSLSRQYRVFRLRKPWRHISLVSIAQVFRELSEGRTGLPVTRKIISEVYKNLTSLSDTDLISFLISDWKKLRF
jgi:hypothetical protein